MLALILIGLRIPKLILKRLHNAAFIFNWRVQHDLQHEGLVLGSGWLRPLLVAGSYRIDGNNEMSKDKQKSFEAVAKPLINWLAENVHPHHTVIVTSTHAELLEGEIVVETEEFLKD